MTEEDLSMLERSIDEINDRADCIREDIQNAIRAVDTVSYIQRELASANAMIAGQLMVIVAMGAWLLITTYLPFGDYKILVNIVCGVWAGLGLLFSISSFVPDTRILSLHQAQGR